MTPVFRPATAADDAVVGELLVRAYVEAYAERMPHIIVTDERKKELRNVALRRKKARVIVMEWEGRVAGSFTLSALNEPDSHIWLPDSTELKQLAISREFHGRGFGDLLVQAATLEARKLGAQNICLHVRKGAVGVAKMYLRAGYQRAPQADVTLPDVDLEGFFLPIARSTT